MSGRKAFALRLDPALHARVEGLAAAELRSVNAQIAVLLAEALRARGVGAQSGDRPDTRTARVGVVDNSLGPFDDAT